MRTLTSAPLLAALIAATVRADIVVENTSVDTAIGFGTLTLPPGFGGPLTFIRSGSLLSTELAETIRDDTWLASLSLPIRQELVDQYGTLSNLDFLTLSLTYGNAAQQIRDLYGDVLADLEANYPLLDFTLTATQSPLDFLGLEVYELFGGELLPPPDPPDTTIIVGGANVNYYEVTGTITVVPEAASWAAFVVYGIGAIVMLVVARLRQLAVKVVP